MQPFQPVLPCLLTRGLFKAGLTAKWMRAVFVMAQADLMSPQGLASPPFKDGKTRSRARCRARRASHRASLGQAGVKRKSNAQAGDSLYFIEKGQSSSLGRGSPFPAGAPTT